MHRIPPLPAPVASTALCKVCARLQAGVGREVAATYVLEKGRLTGGERCTMHALHSRDSILLRHI
jgi:hypothetical protein